LPILLITPLLVNITDAVHCLETPATAQPSQKVTASNFETQKLKMSNFLQDNFAPFAQGFPINHTFHPAHLTQ
jgi:hypothetical protein